LGEVKGGLVSVGAGLAFLDEGRPAAAAQYAHFQSGVTAGPVEPGWQLSVPGDTKLGCPRHLPLKTCWP